MDYDKNEVPINQCRILSVPKFVLYWERREAERVGGANMGALEKLIEDGLRE